MELRINRVRTKRARPVRGLHTSSWQTSMVLFTLNSTAWSAGVGEVSASGPGGICLGGVCSGGCLPLAWGVSASGPGRVSAFGASGVSASGPEGCVSHAFPPPPVDRQTPVKT